MTRLDIAKYFDMPNFDRYFVGFEPMLKRFEEANESLSKVIPNYPPYNIAKVDEKMRYPQQTIGNKRKDN